MGYFYKIGSNEFYGNAYWWIIIRCYIILFKLQRSSSRWKYTKVLKYAFRGF
jgi:hypothetical protein